MTTSIINKLEIGKSYHVKENKFLPPIDFIGEFLGEEQEYHGVWLFVFNSNGRTIYIDQDFQKDYSFTEVSTVGFENKVDHAEAK